jgi:hypothetical protein
VALVWLKLL